MITLTRRRDVKALCSDCPRLNPESLRAVFAFAAEA